MSTSLNYIDDILGANTPAEVTRASFWRARQRESSRIDWGMWAMPGRDDATFSISDIYDDLPWSIRRHLSPNRPLLKLYWRSADTPLGGEEGEWSATRLHFLPEMPREPLLRLARRMEIGALVRGERGEDAPVELLDSEGETLEHLGRDRVGMVETLEMVERLVTASIPIDDVAPDCYVVGGKEGWAVAMASSPRDREKMHERVRGYADKKRERA